jgi:hypothetical protein
MQRDVPMITPARRRPRCCQPEGGRHSSQSTAVLGNGEAASLAARGGPRQQRPCVSQRAARSTAWDSLARAAGGTRARSRATAQTKPLRGPARTGRRRARAKTQRFRKSFVIRGHVRGPRKNPPAQGLPQRASPIGSARGDIRRSHRMHGGPPQPIGTGLWS